MSPTLSLTAWQVILTIFHTLAITSTTFRLWRRYTTRKLWWDDFWAFVALVVDLLFFASVWLRWEVPTGANTVPPQGPLLRRITLFWLSALLTPCVAWPARVSMCMSISRLAPPTARRRRALFALAVVFLLLGAVLTAQKIWICAGDSSWHQNPAVQCYTGKTVGYLSLSTDVVGDACLVAIPLRLLWGVKLPRRERRLVLSLFASSILSTLAGIVYAVFIFRAASFGSYRTLFVNMTAHIKAAVTLLVCNLLVIVTYIYRKLNTEGLETEDETEEESRIGVTTPPLEEKSESVQTPPPGRRRGSDSESDTLTVCDIPYAYFECAF
ncbi:hypothetical protein BDQ17DRAFT_139340 [Cyathus striatus]|nr:hypothetical protein BDQ17DRAFT_139340 [Cyathus striatus]